MPESQIQLENTLLLAAPSLSDGVFDHSVVLLANHSAEEGAFGLILNHPTGQEVSHFLHNPEFEPLQRIPVHIGGPVSPEQLTFSAFWWNPHDGLHCQPRLSTKEAIDRSKQPGVIVRAFIGYSGWSAGQLEGELRKDAWITAKPDAQLFGKTHDSSLWNDLLRRISPYHRILAEAPRDPGMN